MAMDRQTDCKLQNPMHNNTGMSSEKQNISGRQKQQQQRCDVYIQFKDDGPVREEQEVSEPGAVHTNEYVTVVSTLYSTYHQQHNSFSL